MVDNCKHDLVGGLACGYVLEDLDNVDEGLLLLGKTLLTGSEVDHLVGRILFIYQHLRTNEHIVRNNRSIYLGNLISSLSLLNSFLGDIDGADVVGPRVKVVRIPDCNNILA